MVWSKLLDSAKNRTHGHMLSNKMCYYFNAGGKFRPVSNFT